MDATAIVLLAIGAGTLLWFCSPELRFLMAALEVWMRRKHLKDKTPDEIDKWFGDILQKHISSLDAGMTSGDERLFTWTGLESLGITFIAYSYWNFSGFWVILIIPILWVLILIGLGLFYSVICHLARWSVFRQKSSIDDSADTNLQQK